MKKANSFTPRALAAYKKRWRHEYEADFDDSGWWKWLLGYGTGYRAGLAAARNKATRTNG
jgi:hypothetical protein